MKSEKTLPKLNNIYIIEYLLIDIDIKLYLRVLRINLFENMKIRSIVSYFLVFFWYSK